MLSKRQQIALFNMRQNGYFIEANRQQQIWEAELDHIDQLQSQIRQYQMERELMNKQMHEEKMRMMENPVIGPWFDYSKGSFNW